jgi:hypothetical protein|nr:MAG TPA: hypothetical protein [Caudoviricetes sp.]
MDDIFYINGQKFVGGLTDYNFENHRKDIELYCKNNTVLRAKDPLTFTVTVNVNRISLLKVSGIWDWVFENCPDRRVKHLMTYGKNERVRYKNFKHASRLISKLIKEK